MSALTLRLPDEKHARLRALAQSRGTSVNRLLHEVTTLMLAEYDAETRFRLRATRGDGKAVRGLELLDKATGCYPPQQDPADRGRTAPGRGRETAWVLASAAGPQRS